MDVVVFEGDDRPYQRWMSAHRRGYVLSTEKRSSSRRLSLHRSRCNHVSVYGPGQEPGCFTAKSTIKVCSTDRAELERWAKEKRENGESIKGCRTCGTAERRL